MKIDCAVSSDLTVFPTTRNAIAFYGSTPAYTGVLVFVEGTSEVEKVEK